MLLLALLWVAPGMLAHVAAQQPAPDQLKPIVLGYYPGYEGFDMADIPWPQLTHLCHAFLTSDAEGRIETNRHVPDRELTALAAKYGVPVILSIGGWGDADGFEQATSSPERMRQFVEDATAIVLDFGYRGVDVDWEFPKDESTRNRFTALCCAFRQKFDALEQETGKRLLVTYAVTARPQEGQWIDGPALVDAIDFLNVMTYDFSGPWTEIAAHHSPLTGSRQDPEAAWRSTEAAMSYWSEQQGFPRHKLNVGIPLYGRQFPIRQPYESLAGADRKGFGTPEYKQIAAMQSAGWHVTQDAETQTPWLLAPPGQTGVVAFDDPDSAGRKGAWARRAGYRGIFFWAIGHDHLRDGTNPLISAAVAGWKSAAE